MARTVRPLHRRGLGVLVWLGFRDRISARGHAEEDHSFLRTRSRAQDFTSDRREYASQLHLSVVLSAGRTGGVGPNLRVATEDTVTERLG